jgi:hypothetical protein
MCRMPGEFAMQRWNVDFNTMTSEPVDLVKLGRAGSKAIERLPVLHDGERVPLDDEEMAVEATIIFDAQRAYWLARPDDATWCDLPAPPAGQKLETA